MAICNAQFGLQSNRLKPNCCRERFSRKKAGGVLSPPLLQAASDSTSILEPMDGRIRQNLDNNPT